jgi:hypothetical protein
MLLPRRRSANNKKRENEYAVSHRLDTNMDSLLVLHVALGHPAILGGLTFQGGGMFIKSPLTARAVFVTGSGSNRPRKEAQKVGHLTEGKKSYKLLSLYMLI